MNPDRNSGEPWFYTYVLFCQRTDEFYTGYTGDLQRRVVEHKSGQVRSTRKKDPILIYYEACRNESDAQRRERTLKSGQGKRYLRQRMEEFLSG